MIKGPYKSNRWQERWMKLEGILLIIQMLALLVVIGIAGFEWLASGLYLKFGIVFGSGLAMLVLAFLTHSPIFLVGFAAIAIGGALWK